MACTYSVRMLTVLIALTAHFASAQQTEGIRYFGPRERAMLLKQWEGHDNFSVSANHQRSDETLRQFIAATCVARADKAVDDSVCVERHFNRRHEVGSKGLMGWAEVVCGTEPTVDAHCFLGAREYLLGHPELVLSYSLAKMKELTRLCAPDDGICLAGAFRRAEAWTVESEKSGTKSAPGTVETKFLFGGREAVRNADAGK